MLILLFSHRQTNNQRIYYSASYSIILEEIGRLDKENVSFRSKNDRLMEEHAKTLERIDELWKERQKIKWGDVSIGHYSSDMTPT